VYDVSLFLLYLAVYSFIGWVVEVLYVFAGTQHLENRGFLTGPVLPIYGIGAIALLLIVEPYVSNPFLVFVASVIVTSAIEYIGSLMLDKIFHVTLWDYHNRPFNLNGRICLQNSLLFGVLALLLLYVIHPFVSDLLGKLPPDAAIAIAWTLFGILIVDTANSVRSLAKVRPVLDELHSSLAEAHAHIEQNATRLEQTVEEKRAAIRAQHIGTLGRLARVFPNARSVKAPPAEAKAS
jgi:uncharacterized membrane protein